MTAAISSTRLLDLWEASGGSLFAEAAGGQSPARQALALLAAAHPEQPENELAALPLGECQQRLLRLRLRLIGEQLSCVSRCPSCGEELELELAVDRLLLPPDQAPPPAELEIELAGLWMRCRLPTTADLLALEDVADSPAADRRLLEHTVLEVRRGEAAISASDLTTAEEAALGRELAAADPWMELLLELRCEACGHAYHEPFDPAIYLTAELEIHARQLLRQIHLLARAYGWSQGEILALSARRRHAYLEQLLS